MATSAFKSTTRRISMGDDSPSSSNRRSSAGGSASSHHRRSRSLSRFSRPLAPQPDDFSDDGLAPRRRFVNTMRGSGFPEVTLDDLDVPFFGSARRSLGPASNDDAADRSSASQRRGRSVSRHGSRASAGEQAGNGSRVNSDANLRRRRSVSVARYPNSDSDGYLDHSHPSNGSGLKSSLNGERGVVPSSKTAGSNHREGLRRSLSQRDLRHHDGYSSHSSGLTDDEARDGRNAYSNRNGIEKTIRAVYAQKKGEHPTEEDMNCGLYEAMRKELRHAVEEIKLELGHAIGKTDTSANEPMRGVSAIRRDYASKMEMSERRKQDLLAEILKEEEHGRELSKIVKELIPDQKDTVIERAPRTRKKSNERSRMSRRLTEEAEKYIEDFISNVEDTDISSIDGERSDTSSSLVGVPKSEAFQSPAISKSRPVEMDGVVLPWLQWETSSDHSSASLSNNKATPIAKSWEALKNSTPVQDSSNCSISGRGSWSPGAASSHTTSIAEAKGIDLGSYHSKLSSREETRGLTLDVDEYLKRSSEEDFLWERWMQHRRIHTGSLLMCGETFF